MLCDDMIRLLAIVTVRCYVVPISSVVYITLCVAMLHLFVPVC